MEASALHVRADEIFHPDALTNRYYLIIVGCMTLLERSVWGATYARTFHFFSGGVTEVVAVARAINAADRAVRALRQEADSGRLHQDDDLELERCAEADILPENTPEIHPGPTHAGARVKGLKKPSDG